MPLPNLKSLAMFDAAARHGSFRRAAEELNLTQGAVAQQVRQLESSLGATLFHRHARGLTLTQSGSAYHAEIGPALATITQATNRLRKTSPTVMLSVTPSFASKWLVPRLARFAQTHPTINLQTQASETRATFKSDGVTLAIRQSALSQSPKHIEISLAAQNLCAVSAPDTATRIHSVSDFTQHSLIQDGHNHWTTLFQTAGLEPPRRILQFNQTALAMDAAANGQGIALAPYILVNADVAAGKLQILWQNPNPDPVHFHIVHPDIPNPNRDIVISWVKSECDHS